MQMTAVEKLHLSMICELAKAPKDRELDFGFIGKAVADEELWAIDWKYPGLNLKIPTPSDVSFVCDVLDMWERLERGYKALSNEEKARVKKDSFHPETPSFDGFDGNNETELMHITGVLIKDLGRWPYFSSRESFNSHSRSADSYARQLSVWKPLWESKLRTHGPYDLSVDEIISVVREYVHPENRRPQSGGGWTLNR